VIAKHVGFGHLGRIVSFRDLPGLRNGIWGLADQALISVTNLVTMVLLARVLGPEGFGAFALAYTGLLFANSLQGALVVQPHNVLGASRDGDSYVRYTTSTAIGQLAFLGGAALLTLVAAITVHWLGRDAVLLFALVPAIIAWQLQEFIRRVLYTEERLSAAFINDLVSYGGQAVAIVTLWRFERLTGPMALLVLAATSALASAGGIWQVRGSLGRAFDVGELRQNWHHGKWLAGGQIGYWLSTQAYTFLAAAMLGATAAGALKASQILMGPLTVLLASIGSVAPTRLTRVFNQHGHAGLREQVRTMYLVMIPLTGSYCLIVTLAAEPLLRLLYGAQYDGYANVTRLIAAYYLVSSGALIVSAALRVNGLTRPIFVAYTGASVTSLLVGWLIISVAGVEGAVLGMIVSAVILNVVVWRAFRDSRE